MDGDSTTNQHSDAITVGGQKPMFNNSIDRDRITYYASDANKTNNNQPWKGLL